MNSQRRRGAVALLLAAFPVLALPVPAISAVPDQNATPTPPASDTFRDPNNLFAYSPSKITKETIIRTAGALFIVVAMGIGALTLFKRVFPQISGSGSRSIKIRETALLGPRKYLHVVEVSNQRLLLGSTNDRITMLAHLVDDLTHIDLETDGKTEAG